MHVGDGGLDKSISRRIYALLGAMAALLAVGFGPTVAGASAALGPPPWNSGNGLCPASTGSPVGADTGCEWGIDVTTVNGTGEGTTDVINQDADQGPYDSVEDVLVVVENDGKEPLKTLALGFEGSHAETFGFDSDGICSGLYLVSPPCPVIGSEPPGYGYEGPDTTFTVGATSDFGTVNFPTPLAPGEHTYFSLELSPNTILTDSKVNNFVTTLQSTAGQTPAQYMAVNPGVNVTDNATVVGPHGAAASGGDGTGGGTVVYKLFPDNLCEKTPVYTSAAKAVTAGIAAASDPIGASLPAGRYYWQVTYSGDGGLPTHNTESVSLCGNEVLDIGGTKVTTKLSSTLLPPGSPVSDSAVVAGASPPGTATGTVAFTVYSDAKCEKPVAGQSQTVSLTSAAASTTPITLPPGTYYFQASYSGDTKNAPGVSECGSEVLIVQAPPNSNFTPVGAPVVNTVTGAISYTFVVTDPGTFSWLFTYQNGIFGVITAKHSKKCKKGLVRLKGKCRSSTSVFGRGTKSVLPGTVTITIKPSGSATKALQQALKHKKGLTVSGTLTFQSARGGLPVSHPQTLVDKLNKPKKHKGHGHKKH
jgi:Bacterial Ig-like domain (group 3)